MSQRNNYQPPMWVQVLIVLFILMIVGIGKCVSELDESLGSGSYEIEEPMGCQGCAGELGGCDEWE